MAWNKVAGYASAGDRMVHVDFSFPPAGTRVVMGRRRYQAGEVWLLVGTELEEDWNYWIAVQSGAARQLDRWLDRAVVGTVRRLVICIMATGEAQPAT